MNNRALTRRKILKMAFISGGAALCTAGAGYLLDPRRGVMNSANAAPAGKARLSSIKGFTGKRPNIVFILCDDMGQGDTGCYGNTVIRTPNIDLLARQGVRFTDFYASASLCTPSRIGLLTGRYAIRSGLIFPLQSGGQPLVAKILRSVARGIGRMGAFDMTVQSFTDGIPAAEITIADALKQAGYRTGMIGKWHLGDFSKKPEYHPMRHGFDEFFGTPMTNDELPNPLYRNETMLERNIGLNQARLTGLSTREAVGFIERASAARPFFLYLAYHAPHLPLFASEKFKDKSAAGIYGDVIEELDWGVGEVMKALRRKGLEENTLVIFTSDNGPWYEGNPGDAFRGRKGQSYEGGFRDPLVARWPGRIAAGSVCAAPASNIDFFPTLCALAGLALPEDRIIDGKSIAGVLTGREKKSPHDAIFFYHHEKLEGVRAGRWKYLREINHYTWPIPMDKPVTPLGIAAKDRFLGQWPNLYDIERDKGENYDLASRHPEICKRMERIMSDWARAIEKNPGGWTGR